MSEEDAAGNPASQRLDKWLWHARFVKTRTLAQKLISSGGVRVDREKTKSPSFKIKTGQVLTLSLPRGIRIIKVVATAERRGPFEQARLLYEDLTPPQETRKGNDAGPDHSGSGMAPEKRPPRNQRRVAIKMKRNFAED